MKIVWLDLTIKNGLIHILSKIPLQFSSMKLQSTTTVFNAVRSQKASISYWNANLSILDIRICIICIFSICVYCESLETWKHFFDREYLHKFLRLWQLKELPNSLLTRFSHRNRRTTNFKSELSDYLIKLTRQNIYQSESIRM